MLKYDFVNKIDLNILSLIQFVVIPPENQLHDFIPKPEKGVEVIDLDFIERCVPYVGYPIGCLGNIIVESMYQSSNKICGRMILDRYKYRFSLYPDAKGNPNRIMYIGVRSVMTLDAEK